MMSNSSATAPARGRDDGVGLFADMAASDAGVGCCTRARPGAAAGLPETNDDGPRRGLRRRGHPKDLPAAQYSCLRRRWRFRCGGCRGRSGCRCTGTARSRSSSAGAARPRVARLGAGAKRHGSATSRRRSACAAGMRSGNGPGLDRAYPRGERSPRCVGIADIPSPFFLWMSKGSVSASHDVVEAAFSRTGARKARAAAQSLPSRSAGRSTRKLRLVMGLPFASRTRAARRVCPSP